MPNRSLISSKKTAIIVVILLTLLAGSIFFLREMGKRSKAAPGVPTLSYSTNPATLQPGQNFDLILNVNPNGASLFAFELYTAFDPLKVEFQNMTNLPQNITSQYLLVSSLVDSTNNMITITGTRTGSAFSGNANLEIARVKMKVKSGASGAINFNWNSNTKLGSDIAKELLNATFTVGGGGGGGITPGPGVPDLHI